MPPEMPPPDAIAAAAAALAPKPPTAAAGGETPAAGAAASGAGTAGSGKGGAAGAAGAAGETTEVARQILATAERKEASARQKLEQAQTVSEQRIARAELKELILASPIKFLAEHSGLTVEQFLAAYQAEKTGEPAKLSAEEEVAKLRKEIDDERKAAGDRAEAEVIENVEAGIKNLLMSPDHLEEFDHINTRGAHEFVSAEALAYAKKYPDMTPEQGRAAVLFIARKVEAQLDADVVSISKGKKFQQRFAARTPAAVPGAGAAGAGTPAGAAALPGAGGAADMSTIENGAGRRAPPTADPFPTGDPVKRWAAIQAAYGIKP